MKKKIVEGNEKIAKFLGLKVAIKRRTAINPVTGRAMKCSEDVECYLINGKWKRMSELKYHSSWNWLIPTIIEVFPKEYGHNSVEVVLNSDIAVNWKYLIEYIEESDETNE